MKLTIGDFSLEVVEGPVGKKQAMFMSRKCHALVKRLAVEIALGEMSEEEAAKRIKRWLADERARGINNHVTIILGIGDN